MLDHKVLFFALLATTFFIARATLAATPEPKTSNGYATAAKLFPAHLQVDDKGKVSPDTTKWKVEKDAEGTELMSARTGDESRAAIMKNADGSLEALAAYQLRKETKSASTKPEQATGLFFAKGQLSAYTSCEDTGEKDSLGRICVTATPRLCQNLRSGAGVDPETLKEMEAFEMRALASILTLRGQDHQLDNVVRSGNRLGLKTALQTTKGQLIALAKQVSKELAPAKANAAPAPAPAQEKASEKTDAKERAPSADARISDRAKTDELLARGVLEKSLPRLKEACANF